jgi:CDP-6-deoxy-D-xylo-4-hexulose-3-dehydrase
MISALKSHLYGKLEDGDEIIVPAVSWSTTYAPIVQNNLVCKVVDVNLSSLSINTEKIEEAITPKTKAIFCVHLAGMPCNMTEMVRISEKHNLILLEDCCESHGATWCGQKVGTFGLASSFSFMFAHHISTAEGGMVSTSDPRLNDVVRIIRAHGWLRDVIDNDYKEALQKESPHINKDYLFVDFGYNLRMTDLGASFGIHQMDRLDAFIERRRANHYYFCRRIIVEGLDKYIQIILEQENQKVSPLSFPIIANTVEIKDKILAVFEGKVEYRGIAGGNITMQPLMDHYREGFVYDDLPNADLICNNGFWIGNNQSASSEDYEKIIVMLKQSLEE